METILFKTNYFKSIAKWIYRVFQLLVIWALYYLFSSLPPSDMNIGFSRIPIDFLLWIATFLSILSVVFPMHDIILTNKSITVRKKSIFPFFTRMETIQTSEISNIGISGWLTRYNYILIPISFPNKNSERIGNYIEITFKDNSTTTLYTWVMKEDLRRLLKVYNENKNIA
jgi:hypothetical protein